MADFLDFLPLFPDEDEETIRVRWDAWANESLDPVADAERWTDTRVGSFFQVVTEPGVREAARTYERMTEAVAAAVLIYSWGEYLDDHAEGRGVERLAAAFASGEVTFSGPAGTVISAGVSVTAPPASPDDEPPTFEVVTGGVVAAGGSVTLAVRASEAGSGGNLAAGALTVAETPLPEGVTLSNALSMAGGTEPETDEALITRILISLQDRGSANVVSYRSWALEEEGVGKVTVIPLFAGAGTVLVVIRTPAGGPASGEVIDRLWDRLDPPRAGTSLTAAVTLPVATLPVASTGGFRDSGWASIGDELVSYTGKTATSLTGCAGGTGSYVIGARVDQRGRGGGVAPVGHHVVVRTAVDLPVTVSATVEPQPGHSLSGSGGTVAIAGDIEASVAAYVEAVEPGGEIVHARVLGAIASVPGVHDVGVVRVNGGAVNVAVSAYPARAPSLEPLQLTEGVL